jgi:hypothetical protein
MRDPVRPAAEYDGKDALCSLYKKDTAVAARRRTLYPLLTRHLSRKSTTLQRQRRIRRVHTHTRGSDTGSALQIRCFGTGPEKKKRD